MNSNRSKRANQNVIDTVESTLTASTLDDLLEASLSHLLSVNNVKAAEIQLFNRSKKLITVATAHNKGAENQRKHEIMVQSWLLDSTVEYTRRITQFAGLEPVFSVPLMESRGLLGILNIQLNKLRILDSHELNNFYLFGAMVAFKIKEIMLTNEIGELKDHLNTVMSNNRDMQMQVTSLSKELYAISAVSTKINQSMDFDKSLCKAMATTRKFFGAALIGVYIKNGETLKPQLAAFDCEEGSYQSEFIQRIEGRFIKEIFSNCKPFIKDSKPISRKRSLDGSGPDGDLTIVGVPLKSNDNVIGAMILLHESNERFNQEGLRLLSGMANIMAMGIDNMNLFQQSEQKKIEAEFLVRSVARFNESLDLKKTLKTVTKKGVEFVGPECQALLFSEPQVPMIKAQYVDRRGKSRIESKVFKKISPKEIRYIYESMKSQKKSVLIRNLKLSKRFARDQKNDLLNMNIHSMIGVPLIIRKRVLGLLLLINGKDSRTFNNHDLSFAEALGNAASLSIENARTHTASLEMSEFLEKKILKKTSQIQRIQQQQKIRVENRKDIIFRVNKRNRFVFVNRAMENLTGYTREALFRGDIRAEDVVAPEDRERVKECFNRVLKGDFPIVKDFEYRQLNKNGKIYLISLTIYPEQQDHLGKIIGVEGVGVDITEKRRLESELKKAKELVMLGEFSSAVAHQIRNPLGNILMGAKLLQKELGAEGHSGQDSDPNSPSPERPYLNRKALGGIFKDFTDGIQNLNQVVTELLEYTKTLRLSRSSQRIEIILQETLSSCQHQIRQKQIKVEKQFDTDLPTLSVDAVLIGQVFQNIIHNAIQATPKGGRFFLHCGFFPQKAGYALITIHDSGPGIPQSESDKVFHPFFTTKEQGTGLGLSLAHRIVEAHSGMIWVCQNQCHHFVKKYSEQPINEPQPNFGGARIHIMLPIDDKKNAT